MKFYPTYFFRRVTDIPIALLQKEGIRGVILDVDNTLTTHNNPVPHPDVRRWLDSLAEQGIGSIILSNNKPPRVEQFAEILKLPYVANGKKPLTGGYQSCAKQLGCTKKEVAIVGDQLFTDIWGGNRFGCLSVLVEPIEPESMLFFKCKRFLEKRLLRGYNKEGENSFPTKQA